MSQATELFDRLLAVTVALERDMTHELAALGLTGARTHLLWELRRLGPSTQQALSVALAVSPRNITGLVDALENDGFLERRRHPTDRRAALVTLTDRGEQVMARMATEHQELADQLFGGLSAAEARLLAGALDTVAARLGELMAAHAAPERSA